MSDDRPMLMVLRTALIIDQLEWPTLDRQVASEISMLFNEQLDAAKRHLLRQRQELREEEASFAHIERIMDRWTKDPKR